MTKKLTDPNKMLYRYEGREDAEIIKERCYLEPKAVDNYGGLVFGNWGISLRRIDDSVDIDGNQCRGSEVPCIFLTQSYPFFETNMGLKWVVKNVFPIQASEILDQGFTIYQSPRKGCGNHYIIPDPDFEPLYIDTSKMKELDWKWDIYAFGPAAFVSPIQRFHRWIKERNE